MPSKLRRKYCESALMKALNADRTIASANRRSDPSALIHFVSTDLNHHLRPFHSSLILTISAGRWDQQNG
jgi:hypothetical protein